MELPIECHRRSALKPEKCFWYLLDYDCVDGEWVNADAMAMELKITNPNGTKSPIKRKKATEPKATLGIYDSPSGGNEGHLSFILNKATQWVNRMKKWPSPKSCCMDSLQATAVAKPKIQTRHHD
jgi:hypothetical protein